MQIHQQFVFGGLGEQAVVEVHHLLVVAVHEVDLDAFDAELLIPRKRLVHVRIQCAPMRP